MVSRSATPLLLLLAALGPPADVLGLPVSPPPPCPTCPAATPHRDVDHHGHQHLPVPDADTQWLLGGPPAPVQQGGAVPPRLSVRLHNASLLDGYMRSNIVYLLTSFDVDHMLYYFRARAGKPAPQGRRGKVRHSWDFAYKGSSAGRFLMGAGNTLRWIEHRQLRTMMDDVVDGIEACRNASTGYIMAFEPAGFMHTEQGDYGRSWVTQGLIEAGKAGNPKAIPMLRAFYDWFNDPAQNPYLPYLYDGIGNAEQGQIASTRMYLESGVGVYADSQVAQDTYRDDYWLRQLIAGEATSMSDYHMPAPNHPHCYEITAFLSMHDNWRATHNATWLQAAEGARKIVVENFLNVDGTISLAEGRPDAGKDWHPKSYPLRPTAGTGETCCSTFWVKFQQRFQLMAPDVEKYAAEIEKTLYNALLRQLGALDNVLDPLVPNVNYTGFGIRSFVHMQGYLEKLSVPHDNCCEAQGSRVFGSMPEYAFSLNASSPTDGFYLNLFAAATLTFNASVVSGAAPNPPPAQLPPLAPPTPLPPVPPAVPISWKQIAAGGYHKSGSDREGYGYWKVHASSFKECQQSCIDSTHPNNCQGITWLGSTAPSPPPSPVAPSPPLCTGVGCTMESTANRYYNDGAYGAPQKLLLPACNAACLKNPKCEQITYGPGPGRCVLYTAIFSLKKAVSPVVQGYVKCAKHAAEGKGAMTGQVVSRPACTPHLTPGAVSQGCVLFRNIDASLGISPRANVSQWLLQGRRNKVEHDWVATVPTPVPSPPLKSAQNGTTLVSATVDTSFPFDSKVSVTMSLTDVKVNSVSFIARIRVPSWLRSTTKIPVAINGEAVGEGTPGSFLALDRVWSNGDKVTFELPMISQARLVLYPASGIDNIKGQKRYALKVGPIVLSCVGATNADDAIVLPLGASEDPSTWLVPVVGAPLHFTVKGLAMATAAFKPSWDILPGETFTTYPVFDR